MLARLSDVSVVCSVSLNKLLEIFFDYCVIALILNHAMPLLRMGMMLIITSFFLKFIKKSFQVGKILAATLV